ncbi:hypothetical protein emb_1d0256 [Coriobacteriaceae bacterium EMTCatB1]|nr:hypothetical protein emb_1d0256 [Coriobacteriaceae bacterium EMTCatB1]
MLSGVRVGRGRRHVRRRPDGLPGVPRRGLPGLHHPLWPSRRIHHHHAEVPSLPHGARRTCRRHPPAPEVDRARHLPSLPRRDRRLRRLRRHRRARADGGGGPLDRDHQPRPRRRRCDGRLGDHHLHRRERVPLVRRLPLAACLERGRDLQRRTHPLPRVGLDLAAVLEHRQATQAAAHRRDDADGRLRVGLVPRVPQGQGQRRHGEQPPGRLHARDRHAVLLRSRRHRHHGHVAGDHLRHARASQRHTGLASERDLAQPRLRHAVSADARAVRALPDLPAVPRGQPHRRGAGSRRSGGGVPVRRRQHERRPRHGQPSLPVLPARDAELPDARRGHRHRVHRRPLPELPPAVAAPVGRARSRGGACAASWVPCKPIHAKILDLQIAPW